MASNQVINEVAESSPEESNEGTTEYNSVAGVNPNPLVLLIRLEKIDGEPLPESLLTPRHLNMFCLQYAGERPSNLEFLNRYEVCMTFPESTVISVIAGRLMNVGLWHDMNIVVGCTIVPRDRVELIVTARESVRGPWDSNGERQERTNEDKNPETQDHHLRERIDQLAAREDRLSQNLGQYVQQQTRLTNIIEGIGEQLERLESASFPHIQGRDFPTPGQSDSHIGRANFQVKADIDIGKFSGVEPTPQDEVTFEQWVSDVRAHQRQFPDYILLPSVRKSIKGKAKSVLRSLGPDFTIDQAIVTLVREYEGVASSDVVFKDFYQMRQEKTEKVQVFSVRLREALNRLMTRFPDRIPPGDEDKILCDRFFYGMRPEIKNSVRHLFDTPEVTFSILLTAARRNELEDSESKTTRVQSKSGIVDKEESSPRSETINDLKKQVKELTAVMKSGTFPKKSNPPADKKNQNGSNQSQGRNSRSQGNGKNRGQNRTEGDTRNELVGPNVNSSGPFPEGQRPIQCYKCHGWGHPRRICPSRLNFTRGGNPSQRNSPPPEAEPVESSTNNQEQSQ